MISTSNVPVSALTDNPEHPFTAPVCCTHCGKPPSRPPKKRQATGCGPIQLALSPKTALRQKLLQLIHDSRLPHSEFAQYVLGCDEVTIYRYLKGAPIPRSKKTYIQNIEQVSRSGASITLVIRTCAVRPRWRMMLHQRERAESLRYVSTPSAK